MKRFLKAASLGIAFAAFVWADPVITLMPSLAPNTYGSPNWGGYLANALGAIENGHQITNGDPLSPTYYSVLTGPISPLDVIVTGFPSWHAQADPGTVFGAAYANELGNRLYFGLDINGNGTQFSLSQLSFTITSNDPGNYFGYTLNPGNYRLQYSDYLVGIIYDLLGNPTYITSGPNDQVVDRTISRGFGNADDAYCPAPGVPGTCTIAQQQAAIDALLPNFLGMTQLTGTYTLTLPAPESAPGPPLVISATGIVDVTPIPEPSPAIMALIGMVGIAAGKCRKRRG